MCRCAHVWMKSEVHISCLPWSLSILILDTGSLAEREFCDWSNELASKPQGSSDLCLPSPEFQGRASTPSLRMWVLAISPVPYAGTPSTCFMNCTVSLAPHLPFEIMATKIFVFVLTKITKKKSICLSNRKATTRKSLLGWQKVVNNPNVLKRGEIFNRTAMYPDYEMLLSNQEEQLIRATNEWIPRGLHWKEGRHWGLMLYDPTVFACLFRFHFVLFLVTPLVPMVWHSLQREVSGRSLGTVHVDSAVVLTKTHRTVCHDSLPSYIWVKKKKWRA